jgi:hypothetical protein
LIDADFVKLLEIIGDPYQTFSLITKASSTPTVTGNLSTILTVTDNPRTDEKLAKPLE